MKDSAEKAKRAKAAFEAAESLRTALAAQDQPPWLNPLTNAIQQYNPDAPHCANQLIRSIGDNFAAANGHAWAFDFSGDKPFDFDALYNRYEAESKIPELFDNLVALLDEIVRSGEIDSVKVLRALETIIATLKKNRKGSYLSLVCSWNFARTYLGNVVLEVLTETPGLKTFVKPLVKTLEEMDKAFCTVQTGIQTELTRQLNADFPSLSYNAPKPLALSDGTIIDVEATPVRNEDQRPS
jgi:hypothetical protein